MRASFHGQNIIALGNGIARLQIPLVMDVPEQPETPDAETDDVPDQPEPQTTHQ